MKTMKLIEKQQVFTTNIADLICYAGQLGIGLTFGEAHRTWSQVLLNYFGYNVERQGRELFLVKRKRTSWTLRSKHPDRLAVDFNFFINGKLTYKKKDIQKLGDYWESLHPNNSWGGNWKRTVDTPHFQMS